MTRGSEGMSGSKEDMKKQIKELMQIIARRRKGKCKLVYNKNTHTIIAVTPEEEKDTGLSIEDDDTGIF